MIYVILVLYLNSKNTALAGSIKNIEFTVNILSLLSLLILLYQRLDKMSSKVYVKLDTPAAMLTAR